MNAALWRKAIADARAQLLLSCLLLVLFGWFFVWLQSLFKMGAVAGLIPWIPDFVQDLVGIPLEQFITPRGRISVLYGHLIVLLICFGWAIARGSSAISGGIAAGTYELILTLPVRRLSVLFAVGGVATAGSMLLALSVWLGNCLGVATVELEGDPLAGKEFLPGAVNLFFMVFCFTGMTALFSAFDHNRWRTMSVAGGVLVMSILVDMVASIWEPGAWLGYLSFLTAFDPPALILNDEGTWAAALQLNGALLAVGLVCYAVAGLVFSRRDIPVPR